MAQIWNFQTFYTDKLADLDRNLAYYNSITNKPTEYSNPIIFRGLYKLAWDFVDLEEESTLNEVIYGVELAAGRAIAPAVNLVPAQIITSAADGRFDEALNLYCRNIGIVIGAKIAAADNVDEVRNWILENEVFQETLPTDNLTFTPTPVAGAGIIAPTRNLSGVDVIFLYVREVLNRIVGGAGPNPIQQQNLALFSDIAQHYFNVVQPSLCLCFDAELAVWNALGAGYAALVAGLAAAEANYDAYGGAGAFTGDFNAVKFLQNILLTMNRKTAADHTQYELTKQLLNNTPASFSSVKIETENEILGRMQASTSAAAVIAVPQGAELVTSSFTVGYNTPTEELITKMPKRLTHTCKVNCNDIYGATPNIRVISYGGNFYVAPIQTRDKDVNLIQPLAYANNTINTLSAVATLGPVEVPGPIPPTAVISFVAGVGTCACLNLINGMPGPNPQPLNRKGGIMTSTDRVSPCTTDADDRGNMRNLPMLYKSLSTIKGHGDWQSMPNYATCWLIKREDMEDGVDLTHEGVNLGLAGTTGMKVFKFKRKRFFGSNNDTLAVPYDSSNCVLPDDYAMYALWPTGKLLYYKISSRVLQIDPPRGTYWKEWRDAKYELSYLAEIGYQEAKARYEDAVGVGGKAPLSIDDQVELFQRGAFEKVDAYVKTIQRLRAGRAGGSGSNKMKRYNKKTMMSILKTAKRKYFTRRHKKK
jgi:hypothetical protein